MLYNLVSCRYMFLKFTSLYSVSGRDKSQIPY